MNTKRFFSLALTALALLWALPTEAQWSHDPNVNTPVCTAANSQYFPQPVSDGAGGVITTWEDSRSGANDIYAQRLDGSGTAIWTADGVGVCTATGDQLNARLAGDGTGGAIIAWRDPRSGPDYHIYAQRVDGSGTVLWAADGVPVCTAAGNRTNMEMVSDGGGGAIIVWKDERSGNADIYAQRVDGAGTTLWTPNGVPVCTATNYQYSPDLVGDGAGGAIFTWMDTRSGAYDIYAQRMDSSGTALWTVDGVPVCTATANQYYPQLVSNGEGGAIITWYDNRSGSSDDIYAQRVDGSGTALWTANGVTICSAENDQNYPELVSDGSGGAIITWYDYRSGSYYDIYARRIDALGNALWTADGELVCTDTGDQFSPQLVSDGAGGAIIIWTDARFGIFDIYAQGVDGSGNARWAADGVAVSTATNTQAGPQLISDGAGGAIIAWYDARAGFYDIYAQRIERHGYLGGDPSPVITEAIDYPDDQGGVVVLSWMPGYLDEYPNQVVTHYSVWKRIPEGGTVDDTLSGWAHVEDITAYNWEEYASDAPTYGVYTGAGEIPLTEYKVVAQTGDQWVYWESTVASGYSVDNLAPGAPLNLTGLPSGADALLNWTASGHLDEDLALYRIHRSTVSGFTPDGSTQISTATDITFTDVNPGAGTWYYLVTGEDVHGNEGLPSNEASAVTGLASTISAGLTCLPSSGTLPFGTTMTVTLDNLYTGQTRRLSGRLDVSLAGGQSYSSWRAGFTNVVAGGSFNTSWNQSIPAMGTLVGSNVFSLAAQDVTPAPYNQPPYPPAGDTALDSCTVIGVAP